MFDRIRRSFDLARASWNVLRQDKKLVVFPLLSGAGTLLVLFSFLAPIVGLQLTGKIDLDPENNDGQLPVWVYPVAFAFYFSTYFVIIFCNSALVSCAILRFNGEEPSLSDGFRAAASRLPQIFAWALVAATVGMLLKALENAHEKVGQIVSAVLGTAWSVVTFFVVPVLVVEKVGPFQAIRRSLALLRKAWGEALVGNVGLGLFKLLLVVPGLLILAGGVVLAVNVKPIVLGLVVLGLGLLWLLGAGAVSATLDSIFLSALYQYAAYARTPSGFDRRSIEEAFTAKPPA